ncbi:N-acetyltransferase [Ruminococcaceae bacterium OttesenSCG-928-A16]|nr:N-acetyltransferase [Ruminococcaceae bacterium OttesenSCG-928-A16]
MIKEYSPQYLDAIMDIWLSANQTAHSFISNAYWQNAYAETKQQIPKAEVFVFEQEGVVKGFVGIAGQAFVAGLFVKNEYQQQGIGQKLLAHCQKRYGRLELDVYAKNEKAVRFYQKNGFSIAATKANNGYTEHRMVWEG